MRQADREQRLRALFDRALSLPPDQREQVITTVDDEVLAERLRALLAQDAQGTARVLQRAPTGFWQELPRIGRYELLRELGRGGGGTVMLARQLEPVERLVALKIVGTGVDSRDVEQRFAIERQALALMNHPGIARIFDGGTNEAGVPYFVMEYVRGEPITAYCDRRQLGCKQRLALFVEVCAAVQHAHQKAVLHRDLKPGNVLVTEASGSPQPKIIDFGVARALAGNVGRPQPTRGGLMIGTFVYMSPEQADPGGQDVDTRADVYSLGALLYELLTGALPLEFDTEHGGIVAFQRALLETPPPRASVRVQSMPAEQVAECARRRGTTPAALAAELQGDLDWILVRALEKDRNRRYGSALELAADLERHGHDEPVTAGPPTVRYRVTKFVRRHRVTVLAGAVLALGLILGTVGSTLGMLAARAARDVEVAARARQARQLQRQEAVREFFQFVLFYGDPGTGSSPPSLREVLDYLTPSIAPRLAGKPVDESAVRAEVGRAYLGIGEPVKAAQHLHRAWQLVADDANEDAAVLCVLLADLSRARRLAGGPGAGRDELARMLELGARTLAAPQPELSRRIHQMVALLERPAAEWSELQTRCDELLDLVARQAGEPEVLRIAGRLLAALGLRLEDEHVPGNEHFLDRLEVVARQSLGADVDFLQVLGRFAESLLRLGRFEAAHRLAAELVEALARLGLGDHWLHLRAERIRGLSLALSSEPAAGETALAVLQLRLWSLPPEANQEARDAASALVELCARLGAAGQLEPFLAASLQRWQQAAKSDPAGVPWWPAATDGLPAAARDAARVAVEQALGGANSPQLQALHGGLLLREDRAGAAAVALEAALVGLPQPTPELQADLAIARWRIGDPAAAAVMVADLRARCASNGPAAMRCQRALRRVAAAGVH